MRIEGEELSIERLEIWHSSGDEDDFNRVVTAGVKASCPLNAGQLGCDDLLLKVHLPHPPSPELLLNQLIVE